MLDRTATKEVELYNNLVKEYTNLLFQDDGNTKTKTDLTEEQYNKRMDVLKGAFKGNAGKTNKTPPQPVGIKTKVGTPIDKNLQLDNIDIKSAFNKITE